MAPKPPPPARTSGPRRCIGRRRRDRVRERDRGAAGVGHSDRLAIVLELEQERHRARRMAGHGDDLDRHVADRDDAPVGAVILRPEAGRMRAGAGQHARPVAFAIDDGDARDGRLGQVGAAIMVAMGVRIDGIADLVRVEAQESQALVDLSLGRVFEVAVDEDDLALLGDQRVGVVIPRAEEVEVVADLRRRGKYQFSRGGVPPGGVGRVPVG